MLNNLAKAVANEPQYAMELSKNISELERLHVDIERVTRTYQVLKEPELVELLDNYFNRYHAELKKVCQALRSATICRENIERTGYLMNVYSKGEQALELALRSTSKALTSLRMTVTEHLDKRVQNQRAQIESVRSDQLWLVFLYTSISLILALFGSRRILSPVSRIEKMIKELADNKVNLSDISQTGPIELIELEKKLHFLAKRLNQLENIRKAMLRHAAHELKTPLASIKEGCSLLAEQVLGDLTEHQKEVVSLLDTSSQRLENLIEQLLDYNMLLQQSQPTIQSVDVVKLLDTVRKENQLALQQNRHKFVTDCTLSFLQTDPVLFRRILDNLLSNAIAHGSPSTDIYIHLYQHDNEQVLEVGNSGGRILPELREALFKPFTKGDNVRNDRVSGSGLGLSIVSECASLLNGHAKFVDVDYADVCIRVCTKIDGELE